MMPFQASSNASSKSGDVFTTTGAKQSSKTIIYGNGNTAGNVPWWAWVSVGVAVVLWSKSKGR